LSLAQVAQVITSCNSVVQYHNREVYVHTVKTAFPSPQQCPLIAISFYISLHFYSPKVLSHFNLFSIIMFSKWNHVVYSLWELEFFTQHNWKIIHPNHCMYWLSITFHCQVVISCMDIPQFRNSNSFPASCHRALFMMGNPFSQSSETIYKRDYYCYGYFLLDMKA
jgi:hypothetical protein